MLQQGYEYEQQQVQLRNENEADAVFDILIQGLQDPQSRYESWLEEKREEA